LRRFGLLAALMERRMARRLGGLDDGTAADVLPGARTLQLPSNVTIERDLTYGEDPAQRLDLYRPATGVVGAPIVLFVHGGGWWRGDKAMPRMVQNKVPHWIGKGFVFVSTNYRMLPAADVLQQAEDVGRALAFVQRHAERWGGDPARVVLLGHSAGAHLAALITADATIATRHGAQTWQATVALDSAALDMDAIMNRPHYRFYDPVFGSDPAFWREASPLHRLNGKPAAPMLLVCSSQRDDSCQPAHAFAAKAMAAGGRVEILPLALTHAQLNEQLGMPGDYTDAVDRFLSSIGVA